MNCGNDNLINGSNPLDNTSTSTGADGSLSSGVASNGQNPGGGLGSTLFMLIPLALLIVFWFFSSRSQKKKEKEAQEQRNALKIGDELVTIGGIVGRVVVAKPDDDKVTIEVGAQNNRMVIMKWAIQSINKKEDIIAAEKKAEEEKKAMLNGKKAPTQKD